MSGRPPKFPGPRRPITVTLPDSVLDRLDSIDSDRARAIVKATESATAGDGTGRNHIDLVEVTPGTAIILIGPSQLLRKIKWLKLVEVAPMRFLLVIPPGTSIDSVELAIIDLIEIAKKYDEREQSILSELRDLIRKLRVSNALSKGEMLFIDTRTLHAEPERLTSTKSRPDEAINPAKKKPRKRAAGVRRHNHESL